MSAPKNKSSTPWLFRKNKDKECYACSHVFKGIFERKHIWFDCGYTFCKRCVTKKRDIKYAMGIRSKKFCAQCWDLRQTAPEQSIIQPDPQQKLSEAQMQVNYQIKQVEQVQHSEEIKREDNSIEELKQDEVIPIDINPDIKEFLLAQGLDMQSIAQISARCKQIVKAGKIEPQLSNPDSTPVAFIKDSDLSCLYLSQKVVEVGIHGMTEIVISQADCSIMTCKKTKITEAVDSNLLAREVYLMQMVQHPNLVKYDDVAYYDTTLSVLMKTPEFSLADLIQAKAGMIHEKTMAYIIHEVLLALEVLHNAGRVHRSVQPDNIYLGLGGEVMLGDFGYIHQSCKTNIQPYWTAPELIHSPACTLKADIWNIGTLLYYMMDGINPYKNETVFDALLMMSTGPVPNVRNRKLWSEEIVEFYKVCKNTVADHRPSVKALFKHRYLELVEQTAAAQFADYMRQWKESS